MLKIGVISSAALVRQGLKTLLDREFETALLADIPDRGEVAARMSSLKPNLVVIDFGTADAASLAAAVVEAGFHVLALVSDPMEPNTTAALTSGAIAAVRCDSAEEEILAAVRDAGQGRRHVAPALLCPPQPGALKHSKLSKREREVFLLIAKGFNNRQTAQLLFISPKTVETHRGKIYEKLGVHCIADIVHAAYRDGILAA